MPWKLFPVDPNQLNAEDSRLRRSFWLAEERPFTTFVAGVLVVCGVAYVHFKILHGIEPHAGQAWVAGILLSFFPGLPVGMIVGLVITRVIGGLVQIFTGKGMFPVSDSYKRDVDRKGTTTMGCCAAVGIVLGFIIWIIAAQ